MGAIQVKCMSIHAIFERPRQICFCCCFGERYSEDGFNANVLLETALQCACESNKMAMVLPFVSKLMRLKQNA